jgi:hypothetical protein
MQEDILKCVAFVRFSGTPHKTYSYMSSQLLKYNDKVVVRVRGTLVDVTVVRVVTNIRKINKSKATKWIEAVMIKKGELR